jgi:O-antigen/teichoic acid export membrane protein
VLQVARVRPFDTSTPEGRSLERYRRIVLSTAASVAGTAVMALVGLATVPIAVGYLGKEQYGLWAAVSSLVPWVALFDLGLVAGMVIAVSEAHGRDDREAARAYFSTGLFALAGMALLLAVALAVAVPLVPWGRLLEVPASIPPGTARAGVGVALGLAVLTLPLGLVPQVYAGYQKAYVATSFTALGSVLSLALLLAAVQLRGAFAAVVAAAGVAGILAGLASLGYLLLRQMPWLRPSPAAVSFRALRRLLASAVPLYLFQLGSLLVNQSQRPVLANRAGLSTVAEYDLLMRIFLLTTMLISVSTASFVPTFRESWERGELDWMRRGFWRLVGVRMAVATAVSAGLLLAGNLALRVWLRRGDFQFDGWAWATFAALILVAAWSSSFLELMTILDRIWPLVGVVLAQGVLTVALTWFLGPRHGVLGALGALALPAAALSGWILPALAWRTVASAESPPSGGAR